MVSWGLGRWSLGGEENQCRNSFDTVLQDSITPTIHFSKHPDVRLRAELSDPVFLHLRALLLQENLFDFVANFRQRFAVGRLHGFNLQKVITLRRFDDAAVLAGLERERHVAEFLAQDVFADPTPVA